MTFHQLAYFLAVAKHSSFSLAAEELFVSQSSLSKQVRALEAELGTALFSRITIPITLTAAGERFLTFADKMTRDYKDMLFQMSQLSAPRRSLLRVGAIPVLSYYGLIPLLTRFQEEHPKIHLQLQEDDQQRVRQLLEGNAVDFAILRADFLPEGLDSLPLFCEDMVFVCAASHPLAAADTVSVAQLREERFVLLDEKSGIHQLCRTICRVAGFEPLVACTTTHHWTLLEMVGEGLGVALLPRNLVSPTHSPQLTWRPLVEKHQSTTALVRRSDAALTKEGQLFYDFFRERRRGATENKEP